MRNCYLCKITSLPNPYRWEIVTYPNSLHFQVHNRWEIVTYPNSLHFPVHNRWQIIPIQTHITSESIIDDKLLPIQTHFTSKSIIDDRLLPIQTHFTSESIIDEKLLHIQTHFTCNLLLLCRWLYIVINQLNSLGYFVGDDYVFFSFPISSFLQWRLDKFYIKTEVALNPSLLSSRVVPGGLHKWMTHVVDNKSIIPQECQTPFGIAKPWSPPFLVLLLLLLLLQQEVALWRKMPGQFVRLTKKIILNISKYSLFSFTKKSCLLKKVCFGENFDILTNDIINIQDTELPWYVMSRLQVFLPKSPCG